MAEKVEIVDLTINVEKATSDTRALQITMQQLKEESKKLKETQGELSDEYIESQASLKVVATELRTNQKLTQNVIAANDANTGSIDQMRKQLAVVSVQWSKLSKEERTNTVEGKKLTAQKAQLTAALKKEEKATGDTRRNVGNYNQSMGQSVGVLGQFVPAVGRASAGATAMGRAFSVALGPIGLIVAAIALVVGSLKAFFNSTEEGQDTFNELWSVVEVVFNNIIAALAALGKALLEPKETLQEISDFFENTFGNILVGTFKFASENIKKFFNGMNKNWQEFKNIFTDNQAAIDEAQKDIEANEKAMLEAAKRTAEGVKNLGEAYGDAKEAVSEFIEEQKREIEIGKQLAKRQGNLDRQIRSSIVANARDLEKIAKLRNDVAQKENFTSQERLDKLNQALILEEKVLARNLSIAQQKYSIQKAQNALAGSTKEDLDKEANALADIYNVRKSNFEKTRKLETERATLLKTIRAEEQKIADAENAELEAQALEELAITERLLKAELSAEKSHQEGLAELREQSRQARMIEKEAEFAANQDNAFYLLEQERIRLEAQRAQEIAFAKSIGADTTNIKKKFDKADLALEKAKVDAKLSLGADFASNLAQIAGEGTAVGKAAAIASTTISTYQAATGAYASLAPIPIVGPALGIAAAGAAVAAGLANVKNILSVDSGLPGDSSGGGGSISSSTAAAPQRPGAIAPTVNQGIISRDSINNNNDNNITVQPTLVIDDVTNAQNSESANNTTSVI